MKKAKDTIEEETKVSTDEIVETNDSEIMDSKKFLTLKQTGERNWYVIHTYSGYEEQVADSLKQRIESMNMGDKIFDVVVPKEKQIEIKNGKRKIVEKKIFPGYVIVDMIVTDDSWYVVRNTPNVTGFIGFGVRPTPMSKEEIDRIRKRMGVEEPKYMIDLRVDDLVKITDGALKGFEGKVEEVDQGKGKVKVLVNMFGRETPVNLDFLQVKKV
jgi:transcriptional antiterminator NusG